tara:strand:+ start:47 stop:187 length:141 start_codon:yes stop_codon:yes gene_type:complete
MIVPIDKDELEAIVTLIKDNNQYNDDSNTIKFWDRIICKLNKVKEH